MIKQLCFWASLFAALTLGDVAYSQQCVTPPGGNVAWWAADGDATDLEGNHNGTLFNGTTFATGEVGQAFNFGVTQHQYVDVGFSQSAGHLHHQRLPMRSPPFTTPTARDRANP